MMTGRVVFCFLLLVGLVVSLHQQTPSKHKRFLLNDPSYSPKYWKLTPRSYPQPYTQPNRVSSVTPDDYFNFIPTYVGTVYPNKPLTWSAPCFKNNVASLSVSGNSAEFSIVSGQKSSFFCDDGYIFGYVGSFDLAYLELPINNTFTFDGPWTTAQQYDLVNNGIRVFIFPDGLTVTLDEIFETVMLFFGGLIGAHVPEWTAEDNLEFLKNHMNVTFEIRNITRVDLPQSEIKSGDFLGIIRMDGLDPMLAWGMGSHTGHTAITMWIDGQLYVLESTTNSAYWPTNGIQKTPWNQWLDQAQKASYNVVHLPLDPNVAKRFNVQKAINFFNSVEGLPYGFHNLFTGWIDTAEDNYPPPLNSHLVMLLAPFAEWLLGKELNLGVTFDFVTQGFNKRLGTNNLTLDEVYMEMSKRNMQFTDLTVIPEQDKWIFQDNNGVTGPSMVCDVLVSRLWKEGGLFGNLADDIQTTEFTNWDAYTLNFFDKNYVRPAACVKADPDSQFCQLLGLYRMQLPQYNTFAPFKNMREHCPSLPPKYIKPANC